MWPQAALVVEVDGRAPHLTRRAFELDRVRDADLTVAGWRVVRLTEERLESEPDEVTAQLLSLLKPAGDSAGVLSGASDASALAKASTTLASNWVPARALSSARAASSDMRLR